MAECINPECKLHFNEKATHICPYCQTPLYEKHESPESEPSSETDHGNIEEQYDISPDTQEPQFFSNSTLKLVLMSICTFGIYELYWFYKNWSLIKSRTGQKIMPFWRAFFAPFWAFSCFKHIKYSGKSIQIKDAIEPGILAFMYFIFSAMWRLPEPFDLISTFTFAFILPANTLANKINTKLCPEYTPNSKFSPWNWVGLILGGALFVLAVFATFLPEA